MLSALLMSPSAESRDEAGAFELLKENSKSIAQIATLGDGYFGKLALMASGRNVENR
jgi:hypothetical protein